MFIDTNVFINPRIPDAPAHAVARDRLEHALQDDEPLRISCQIIREGNDIFITRVWGLVLTDVL